MKEKDLQKGVIDVMRLFNWRVAHFRTAMGKRGNYMTPVAGDGKGFPDLCAVRGPRLIFSELKVGYNKPSPEQITWMEALEGTGAEVYLWTDKDWEAGTIEEVLA